MAKFNAGGVDDAFEIWGLVVIVVVVIRVAVDFEIKARREFGDDCRPHAKCMPKKEARRRCSATAFDIMMVKRMRCLPRENVRCDEKSDES